MRVDEIIWNLRNGFGFSFERMKLVLKIVESRNLKLPMGRFGSGRVFLMM